MPRAPCCDQKLGLKKGPWTRDEDQILINYVQTYGHANWRALPKQAGLLRCGKSCRLRWINYLRPDIKRGNFSPEEEDAIIHLHQTLGNRWSAIAARLPGRTDNEIKNVWHTHLKKRVVKKQRQSKSESESEREATQEEDTKLVKVSISSDDSNATSQSSANYESDVTQQSPSSSEYSSTAMDMLEPFPEIDDSFWTDDNMENIVEALFDDGMDFWYNVLLQAEDDLSLPKC